MKYLATFTFLISLNIVAGECHLDALTQNDEKIETSFQTKSSEDCKDLANNSGTNRFFGILGSDTVLTQIQYHYKDSSDTLKEEITF